MAPFEYFEGMDAFDEGKTIKDCPYMGTGVADQFSRSWWTKGFTSKQIRAKQEE